MIDPCVAILERLVAHYKITPAFVKRTLADDPENKWALAWQDVLKHIKDHPHGV